MRTRKLLGAGLFVVLVVGVAAAEKIKILDTCDPTDPTWASVGGCLREEGDVTLDEFNALLVSPLSLATPVDACGDQGNGGGRVGSPSSLGKPAATRTTACRHRCLPSRLAGVSERR